MADEAGRLAPGKPRDHQQHRPSIDLAPAHRRQLLDAGVDVADVGGCTMLEQPERFFSYRRDGVTGRHAGVVWLT